MKGYFGIRHAALTVLTAAVVAACADKDSGTDIDYEQLSLDAWVAKHINATSERAIRQDNGMWLEITDAGQTDDIATKDTILWVKYNFTVRDLIGNIAFSRLEDIARWQGTFTRYTHYVPDYIYCGDYNSNLLEGTYYMMRNTMKDASGNDVNIHIGTKGTIYLPSTLAYGTVGTSNDAGYGGQYSLDGSIPTILDFEIVDITKDPVKTEEAEVDAFIAGDASWKPVSDTLTYLYVDKTFRLPEGETAYQGDSILVDTTVNIWYVGKFLDGFVFDTNIDSVKLRVYGEVASTGEALEFTYNDPESTTSSSSDESSYINMWNYAIPTLLQGQWARIIGTSYYGYGSYGQYRNGSSSTTSSSDYYYNYYNLYNNYYTSYYNSYYNSYYGSYYDYYNYYNYLYGSTSDTTESTTSIYTEIQSYTPLLFEIYIEE